MLGEGVAERGKEGEGKRGREGGGTMMGVGRVVRGFNRGFDQNRYHYGYRHAHYETKSAKIMIFGGIPQFLSEFPCNDITISPICHNLAKKKSENEKVGNFT